MVPYALLRNIKTRGVSVYAKVQMGKD